MRIGGVIMARRQTLKYLLREELASKKEAGYGRSKHNDKLKTEQEREKLGKAIDKKANINSMALLMIWTEQMLKSK